MQVSYNPKYVVTSIIIFPPAFLLQLLLNYWIFLPLFLAAVRGGSLPAVIDDSFSHPWLLLISYSRHVYIQCYYERFLLCDFIIQLLQEGRTRNINTFVIKQYVDFQIRVLKCLLSKEKNTMLQAEKKLSGNYKLRPWRTQLRSLPVQIGSQKNICPKGF